MEVVSAFQNRFYLKTGDKQSTKKAESYLRGLGFTKETGVHCSINEAKALRVSPRDRKYYFTFEPFRSERVLTLEELQENDFAANMPELRVTRDHYLMTAAEIRQREERRKGH